MIGSALRRTVTPLMRAAKLRLPVLGPNRFRLSRGFFGLGGKKKQEEKTTAPEDLDVKDTDNLSFLIEDVRKVNQLRANALLPPMAREDAGKLTVCMEMDDVFLFVFAPDELEGYLYQPRSNYDFYVEMPEFETSLYVYKRPGCDKFLEYMRAKAEGVIFSTGAPFYVDKIMDLIDKDRTAFKHRIYQDQCNRVEYQKENIDVLVKDLSLLGRDLNRTVLIDTKPFSFWCNPDNSIPVQEFRGSTLDDPELDTLAILLEDLRTKGDVRPEVTKRFQVRDSLKECNML